MRVHGLLFHMFVWFAFYACNWSAKLKRTRCRVDFS